MSELAEEQPAPTTRAEWERQRELKPRRRREHPDLESRKWTEYGEPGTVAGYMEREGLRHD